VTAHNYPLLTLSAYLRGDFTALTRRGGAFQHAPQLMTDANAFAGFAATALRGTLLKDMYAPL